MCKIVFLTGCLFVLWCTPATVFGQQSGPQSSRPSIEPTSTRPASGDGGSIGLQTFQPGIRIHWQRSYVEVDANVVLREGLIELFACSPNIREYESIVRINAQPVHLFMALGLIGLKPGAPLQQLDSQEQLVPPHGDAVEVRVRYRMDDKTHDQPIEHWLRLTPVGIRRIGRTRLPTLPWVFAGSFPIGHGEIAADREGTVIALVNFASALVALPALHPASYADLWVEPATEHIPPVGSPCTLLFRRGPIRLRTDSHGQVFHQNHPIPLSNLTDVILKEGLTCRRIRILIDDNDEHPLAIRRADQLQRLLLDLGIPETSITREQLPPKISRHDLDIQRSSQAEAAATQPVSPHTSDRRSNELTSVEALQDVLSHAHERIQQTQGALNDWISAMVTASNGHSIDQ